MKINWHRQHRWSSLAAVFFLAVFCLSGVALNHRQAADRVDVPRGVLPPFYRHSGWNLGLMRGTAAAPQGTVVFGSGGMWLTDSLGSRFADFNEGLPPYAAGRQIAAMAAGPGGSLLALSPEALYVRSGARWTKVADGSGERLADLTVLGDSTVVVGRSRIFVSPAQGAPFVPLRIAAPEEDGFGRTTAFRTVWMLHSGELFGTAGRLAADALAAVLLVICATGLCVWLIPKRIRRLRGNPASAARHARRLKGNLRWHDRLGRWTIAFTLLITLTGWLLRPPALIALAQWRVPPPPGSALDDPNPWHDKLRAIRFDSRTGCWLLATSEGFYALDSLDAVPRRLQKTPPVSVMGINVFEPTGDGRWLIGSFSGLYEYDPATGVSVDHFTGLPAPEKAGPPFGKKAVAGYSRHFTGGETVVLYDEGTPAPRQPEVLSTLPMPLWSVALEAHTGRIFFGNSATWFYVFLTGGVIFWSLVSGYKVRRRKADKTSKTNRTNK